MHVTQHVNSHFAAQFIAAEERHQALRKASRQARLIKESELAFGQAGNVRPGIVRRGLGVALIRAGNWLKGAPTISTHTRALPVNG